MALLHVQGGQLVFVEPSQHIRLGAGEEEVVAEGESLVEGKEVMRSEW